MAKKFASKLTDAQFKLAREFERANELTDNFLPGLAIHLLRVATRTNSPTTADMNLKREDTEHDKRKHDPTTDASAQ